VNVNTAGVEELAQLPGLGPATARRLVDHRRQHGPFARLDDLLDVPGIGPATLAAIRPHLRPIAPRETTP
jgi:competence protein ComEA